MHDPEIDYVDEELFQATFIFQEVFLARLHKRHKDKVNFEGLCELAEEAGKSIHQNVLLFTRTSSSNSNLNRKKYITLFKD